MSLDWSLVLATVPLLARGAWMTVRLSIATGLLALAGGAVLALLSSARLPLLRGLAHAFIGAMRGIPPLVLILIAFYVLPNLGLLLSPEAAGVMALAGYFSAYVAVALTGALAAVPPGQTEAGLVVGMTPVQRLVRIVLPQALPIALPVLCGLLIGLVKETALLSVISVGELTFATKQAVSRTYAPFEVYLVAALLYWAISIALESLARLLEHRATRFRRGTPALSEGRNR